MLGGLFTQQHIFLRTFLCYCFICASLWNAATVWQFGLCLHEPVLPGLGHSRLSAGCRLIVSGFLHCKPGASGSILLDWWWQNQVEPAAAGSLGHAFAWAWGIRFFFFIFERVNGNCLLKTPKGVSDPEGSEPAGRLVDTAQSCLRRVDPAWRRLFILPLGCSCFYPVSTWINRSRTSSAARLRICQNSPGNGWFTSSRGRRKAVSKRPAYADSHFLCTSSSGLGCLLQDTSVFKWVVSLYNGTDGFGFQFREMVISQAGGGNNTSDCHVKLSLGWHDLLYSLGLRLSWALGSGCIWAFILTLFLPMYILYLLSSFCAH